MKPSTRTRTSAIILTCLLVMVGCGTGSARRAARLPQDRLTVNAHLHADLPAAIQASGTLRVLTDASYAPASSFAPDGRTIIGFEPDLGAALGRVLGVKVVFINTDFADLPAEVTGGHADMIMSAMTDTATREQRLDFVNYFSAGTALVVQRGNPHSISDLESLCGQPVAVEAGTVQADLLNREQAHCGLTPIRIISKPTNDDALLQLRTGQAAALPMDYPPAEELTSQPRTRPNYQLASTAQYEPGLYGIGFAKNQQALRDTVQAALAELITTGAYLAILQTWHVAAGAITQASINAAQSTN